MTEFGANYSRRLWGKKYAKKCHLIISISKDVLKLHAFFRASDIQIKQLVTAFLVNLQPLFMCGNSSELQSFG